MNKIFLRNFKSEDLLVVEEYVTSKKVAKFLTWKAYSNKDEILDYFQKALNLNKYPNEFLIIMNNNNAIGTTHIIFRGEEITQIGFGILPKYWNQGIGSLILPAIIKYIKKSEFYEKSKIICADISIDNIAAIKIFIKNNFILYKQNFQPNRDRYIYKL